MPRNDDEDDDRPRKRRRPRDDEDEDDRPQKRRPSRDDEDDDRPRARARARGDEDDDSEEADYDDRPRKRRKKKQQPQVSVLGIVSLVTGGLALGLSFSCFGGLAVVPGLIGLGLGIFGFLAAQNSRGRQSPAFPIGGVVLNLAAVVVSVIAIVSFARGVKQFEKDLKEGMEQAAKEEAERKKELAKAATEVKAAGAGAAIQMTAAQFNKLFDDDEDRFEALYKNKIIELTGTFHEFDFSGETYTVLLRAGGPDDTVSCEFAKDPNTRALLAQLKPGDQVRIRGKCLDGFPALEACVLVQ